MKRDIPAMDEKARMANGRTDTNEFPLPVAEDWDEIVKRSMRIARIIDVHLDFEENFQGLKMRPVLLCPEQRVSLLTDISATV